MPHYYAADLWSKVDIQHFNVLLPTTGLLNTMPHYYAADLWSKVDQHFNVSSCQQLASSILCLTAMQLIFGPRWIFNILMCPLANNWPPQYYAPPTMQLIFGPGGYSTFFMCPLANNWPPQYYAPHY
jgi:hypothetical protein